MLLNSDESGLIDGASGIPTPGSRFKTTIIPPCGEWI